jgi:hypothetical protein
MKRFVFFIIVLSTFIFSNCDKPPPPQPVIEELDISLIPGIYSGGSLLYYPPITNSIGAIVPDIDFIEDLSSSGGDYQITVTKAGESNYTISFDDSFIYSLPDFDINITETRRSDLGWIGVLYFRNIILINDEEYSPTKGVSIGSFSNYIPAIFIQLDIKSNDPDSIYFLSIIGSKDKLEPIPPD